MQLPWRVSIKSCRYHVCRWPGTISGPCSALLEPDPNSKTDPTLNPVKARLCWDRRGILADPISGTAVLEYGPTEILPPVGAKWKPLHVSADRVAKPAAHTRAESRRCRPSNADAAERLTLRWREMDSNSSLEGDGFELSVPGHETVKPSWETALLSRKRKRICSGTESSNPSPLQRGVDCEPDFRGRILSMTVGPFFFPSCRPGYGFAGSIRDG